MWIYNCTIFFNIMYRLYAGADPGFQVRGGGVVKKFAPSGGRREKFWGISCEKSRFYAKKNIFSNFRGGRPVRPPLDPPLICYIHNFLMVHYQCVMYVNKLIKNKVQEFKLRYKTKLQSNWRKTNPFCVFR
jgi:hypothetical protein